MTALWIILGIVAFFFILLSIPLHISFEHVKVVYLSVRWLFLKFDILPLEDKPQEEKVEEEKTEEEEAKEEKPKEKKESSFNIKERLSNLGYDGVMEILGNFGHALSGMFKRIFKSFRFDFFDIYVRVGKGDAAATAVEYGKTCSKVYPVCGLLCSTCRIKKYDVNVEADFLANKNVVEVSTDFYLVPRKLINALIIVGVELLFKVLLKFLSKSKSKNTENKKDTKELVKS